MATCKGCGAKIIWAITDRGKRMPIDEKSQSGFTINYDSVDKAHANGPLNFHLSHFATCTVPDQFRKKP